jgi:hypothetical protein
MEARNFTRGVKRGRTRQLQALTDQGLHPVQSGKFDHARRQTLHHQGLARALADPAQLDYDG